MCKDSLNGRDVAQSHGSTSHSEAVYNSAAHNKQTQAEIVDF